MDRNLATALELLFAYSPTIILFILAVVISKTKKKESPEENKQPMILNVFYAFALLLAIVPTVWLAMVILKVSL